MKFASVGSGSRGNSLVVSHAQTNVLLDCGLPLKVLKSGLERLGMALEQLDAVFVTHEHGDHIKGLGALVRKTGLPVYMTEGTAYAAGWHDHDRLFIVRDGEPVELGSLLVEPVIVPHDAREPCQFVFREQTGESTERQRRLGVLTDLGSLSAHVVEAYSDCDALVLESNHDVELLRQGPYPPSLKARVLGDWGHLSNVQARDLLAQTVTPALQWLVLAHISQQNNSIELARDTLAEVFPDSDRMLVAEQDGGFDWLCIQ